MTNDYLQRTAAAARRDIAGATPSELAVAEHLRGQGYEVRWEEKPIFDDPEDRKKYSDSGDLFARLPDGPWLHHEVNHRKSYPDFYGVEEYPCGSDIHIVSPKKLEALGRAGLGVPDFHWSVSKNLSGALCIEPKKYWRENRIWEGFDRKKDDREYDTFTIQVHALPTSLSTYVAFTERPKEAQPTRTSSAKPIFVSLTQPERNTAVEASRTTAISAGDLSARFALYKSLEIPKTYWMRPLDGIRVRIGTKLFLRSSDPVLDRYVLVFGQALDFVVYGWMAGYHGFTEEFAEGDRCIVPGERLNSILELKEDICKQLDCPYSSTVDHPVVNRSTGVQLPVRAPPKDQITSKENLISPKMRFAMYDIERHLKEESPIMKELTAMAMADKEYRFTAAGKLKKEPKPGV